MYNQFVGLLLLLVSPLVWLYHTCVKLFEYIKAKQRARANTQAYEKYYSDDFKQKQKEEWEKEQARQDEKAQREFREREAKREQQKRESHREYEEQKKEYQEEQKANTEKTTVWWQSNNPYEVLQIKESATQSEIKKAYRKLAKIYHPDMSLVDKAKAEEIFKKINEAYEGLK